MPRILFIVPGQTVGHCAICDYTFQVSEMAQKEARVAIHSLYPIDEKLQSARPPPGVTLSCGSSTDWDSRIEQLGETLHEFRPDHVSVQFVPQTFVQNGFLWSRLRAVSRLLSPFNPHCMAHESWSNPRPASLLNPCRDALRRFEVMRGIQAMRVSTLHVSNPFHQRQWERAGFKSEIVPVHSNIDRHPLPESVSRLEDLADRLPRRLPLDRETKWFTAVVLSRIPPNIEADELVRSLAQEADRLGRKLRLVSLGNVGFGEAGWNRLSGAAKSRGIESARLGFQPVALLSWVLQVVDVGVATISLPLWSKSSGCATLVLHEVPLVFPPGSEPVAREHAPPHYAIAGPSSLEWVRNPVALSASVENAWAAIRHAWCL